MPWLFASPGHQNPWYSLCRIGKSLSYMHFRTVLCLKTHHNHDYSSNITLAYANNFGINYLRICYSRFQIKPISYYQYVNSIWCPYTLVVVRIGEWYLHFTFSLHVTAIDKTIPIMSILNAILFTHKNLNHHQNNASFTVNSHNPVWHVHVSKCSNFKFY